MRTYLQGGGKGNKKNKKKGIRSGEAIPGDTTFICALVLPSFLGVTGTFSWITFPIYPKELLYQQCHNWNCTISSTILS